MLKFRRFTRTIIKSKIDRDSTQLSFDFRSSKITDFTILVLLEDCFNLNFYLPLNTFVACLSSVRAVIPRASKIVFFH